MTQQNMQQQGKQALQKSPANIMNSLLNGEAMQDSFIRALGDKDKAGLFAASVLELYSGDDTLQKCEPGLVIKEAMKAAQLDLPLSKSLGFAWVVPRWSGKMQAFIPQFQPGWKGIVQLAQRTAMYRYINCGVVYEGELRKISKLTGELDIEGEASSDKIIGYFAYIQLTNGFSKSSYWTKERMTAHALKYNQESKKAGKLTGNWAEYFDERAQATVLKHLIAKFGIMSIQMREAVSAEDQTPEELAAQEIASNANTNNIDFATAVVVDDDGANVDKTTGEVKEPVQAAAVQDDGPGY
jgi:recombination protein RecT